MKILLEKTRVEQKTQMEKRERERGKAPLLCPIDGRIIHLIHNNKQLRHTQGFCKLNMLTGLSTSLVSSFEFPFSRRNYLERERERERESNIIHNAGPIKDQCRKK
jgi:hypothetical protein